MLLQKAYLSLISKPKKKAVIVVPIYKKEIADYEKTSLLQCIRILGKSYPITFITYKSLDLSQYKSIIPKELVVNFTFFEESYFNDIRGYNELMLSANFYSCFLEYEYILIHQLDAFVFKDELSYWCNKNYDYVGAPWINPGWHEEALNYIYITTGLLKKSKQKIKEYKKNNSLMVGNGGFSLRKVKSFYLISLSLRKKLRKWEKNEDVFWSIVAPVKFPFFKIPNISTARAFAFEMNPQEQYLLNKMNLPFGCHGFTKYDIDFWKPFIQISE
jgi:hypothetical protein